MGRETIVSVMKEYIKAHSPCRGCENKDHCKKVKLRERKACGQYVEWVALIGNVL